jgi:hypothetical protein
LPARAGESPKRHLKGYTSVLQADACAGFNSLYEGGKLKEATCRAHARRYFHDVRVATKPPVAVQALVRIADQPSNRVHELLPWAVADAPQLDERGARACCARRSGGV